jgi:ketosteroid isomerase-like protein
MGEAREAMDRVTEAAFNNDEEGMKAIYAPEAIAETPDQGTIKGQDGIVAWFSQFTTAFPDGKFQSAHKHETGDTAIDEGWLVATHTGPLDLPDGTSIPPTGNSIRVRGCDVVTVEGGRIVSHRFYFDQLDFLGQLGLMEGMEAGAAAGSR